MVMSQQPSKEGDATVSSDVYTLILIERST